LNAAGRLRGRSDPPLDAEGIREAQRLGRDLASWPVTAVVSSPRRRALQTAAAIATVHDVGISVDVDLEDRDYGPWTGHPRDEVERAYGSLDAAPGVEQLSALRERVLTELHRLLATHGFDDGTLVVVAHDAVNQALLGCLVPALAEQGEIVQHTGCWNHLVLTDGCWEVPVLNAVPAPSAGTGASS
jgi:probable phosphoglycerate mutase